MNDSEKLLQLIDAVSDMRIFQKAFFAAQPGSHDRYQNLRDAQSAELRVDKLLAEFKSKQVKIEF